MSAEDDKHNAGSGHNGKQGRSARMRWEKGSSDEKIIRTPQKDSKKYMLEMFPMNRPTDRHGEV